MHLEAEHWNLYIYTSSLPTQTAAPCEDLDFEPHLSVMQTAAQDSKQPSWCFAMKPSHQLLWSKQWGTVLEQHHSAAFEYWHGSECHCSRSPGESQSRAENNTARADYSRLLSHGKSSRWDRSPSRPKTPQPQELQDQDQSMLVSPWASHGVQSTK